MRSPPHFLLFLNLLIVFNLAGDGHETDFMGDRDVHIFDAFTPGIFPNDRTAMMAIKTRMHFRKGDDGTAFLRELKPKLAEALASFTPDLVIYNAGA